MDHKTVERIKQLIKESNQILKASSSQQDKTRTILTILGNLMACIALHSNEIDTLYKMHVGLERGFIEVEEVIKGLGKPEDQESKDWKMLKPEWEEGSSQEKDKTDV